MRALILKVKGAGLQELKNVVAVSCNLVSGIHSLRFDIDRLNLYFQHAEVSVDELVGFTGAFAGCAVMLIIPAFLVYSSRR